MKKIMKVVFTLKRHSPSNFVDAEYFVDADNEKTAHKKALKRLTYDIEFMSFKFNCSSTKLLSYFKGYKIDKINVLN